METLNREQTVAVLNRIVACELAGVARYTQFLTMVDGDDHIPMENWLRAQAEEDLRHAQRAGRLIALLRGHPASGIAPTPEADRLDVDAMLRESLKHEQEARAAYQELLELSQGRSVFIADYARDLIVAETTHADQIDQLVHGVSGREARSA